jgi:L-glyceraldehyde 3-phosphate reductase
VLKDEDVTGVIIGASRAEQLDENLVALENTRFSDDELRRINEININN